jgi:hypothetical protein
MRHVTAFAIALVLVCASLAHAADVSVTAGNVSPSVQAITSIGTAGGTITAGQTVYQDAAGAGVFTIKAADTDASATTARVVGVAISGAATGQKVTYVTYDPDFTGGFTATVGVAYVLGDDAGGIKLATGLGANDYTTFIGVGRANGHLYLRPFVGDKKKP